MSREEVYSGLVSPWPRGYNRSGFHDKDRRGRWRKSEGKPVTICAEFGLLLRHLHCLSRCFYYDCVPYVLFSC